MCRRQMTVPFIDQRTTVSKSSSREHDSKIRFHNQVESKTKRKKHAERFYHIKCNCYWIDKECDNQRDEVK